MPLQAIYTFVLHVATAANSSLAKWTRNSTVLQVAGAFEVRLSGCGLGPKEAPVMELSCLADSRTTRTITYVNPFLERVTATVTLDACPGPPVDGLSVAGPNGSEPAALEPQACAEFTVAYTPRDGKPAGGVALINVANAYTSKPLPFRYPVQASTEADVAGPVIQLATKARQELQETLPLQLEGLQVKGKEPAKLVVSAVGADGTPLDKHGLAVTLVCCSLIALETFLLFCLLLHVIKHANLP